MHYMYIQVMYNYDSNLKNRTSWAQSGLWRSSSLTVWSDEATNSRPASGGGTVNRRNLWETMGIS